MAFSKNLFIASAMATFAAPGSSTGGGMVRALHMESQPEDATRSTTGVVDFTSYLTDLDSSLDKKTKIHDQGMKGTCYAHACVSTINSVKWRRDGEGLNRERALHLAKTDENANGDFGGSTRYVLRNLIPEFNYWTRVFSVRQNAENAEKVWDMLYEETQEGKPLRTFAATFFLTGASERRYAAGSEWDRFKRRSIQGRRDMKSFVFTSENFPLDPVRVPGNLGGHAVVLQDVALMKDGKKYFIFQNSWGEGNHFNGRFFADLNFVQAVFDELIEAEPVYAEDELEKNETLYAFLAKSKFGKRVKAKYDLHASSAGIDLADEGDADKLQARAAEIRENAKEAWRKISLKNNWEEQSILDFRQHISYPATALKGWLVSEAVELEERCRALEEELSAFDGAVKALDGMSEEELLALKVKLEGKLEEKRSLTAAKEGNLEDSEGKLLEGGAENSEGSGPSLTSPGDHDANNANNEDNGFNTKLLNESILLRVDDGDAEEVSKSTTDSPLSDDKALEVLPKPRKTWVEAHPFLTEERLGQLKKRRVGLSDARALELIEEYRGDVGGIGKALSREEQKRHKLFYQAQAPHLNSGGRANFSRGIREADGRRETAGTRRDQLGIAESSLALNDVVIGEQHL